MSGEVALERARRASRSFDAHPLFPRDLRATPVSFVVSLAGGARSYRGATLAPGATDHAIPEWPRG